MRSDPFADDQPDRSWHQEYAAAYAAWEARYLAYMHGYPLPELGAPESPERWTVADRRLLRIWGILAD